MGYLAFAFSSGELRDLKSELRGLGSDLRRGFREQEREINNGFHKQDLASTRVEWNLQRELSNGFQKQDLASSRVERTLQRELSNGFCKQERELINGFHKQDQASIPVTSNLKSIKNHQERQERESRDQTRDLLSAIRSSQLPENRQEDASKN